MRRFGYLSDVDRSHQAEAFVRLCERSQRTDWSDYFDAWAGPACKDFHPGDAQAIRQQVHELMIAGGASTLVDPLDWLLIGRDPAEAPVA
jgi:hypothetical protein